MMQMLIAEVTKAEEKKVRDGTQTAKEQMHQNGIGKKAMNFLAIIKSRENFKKVHENQKLLLQTKVSRA